MSQQIIEVLEYLFEKFGIAIDWTAENILPYVQELGGKVVTYKIVSHAIGVFILTLLFIVGVVFVEKIIKSFITCKQNGQDNPLWDYYSSGCDPTNLCFISIIVSTFVIMVGVIGLCCTIPELLEWIIIPEIQLVEYVSDLMNSTAA